MYACSFLSSDKFSNFIWKSWFKKENSKWFSNFPDNNNFLGGSFWNNSLASSKVIPSVISSSISGHLYKVSISFTDNRAIIGLTSAFALL